MINNINDYFCFKSPFKLWEFWITYDNNEKFLTYDDWIQFFITYGWIIGIRNITLNKELINLSLIHSRDEDVLLYNEKIYWYVENILCLYYILFTYYKLPTKDSIRGTVIRDTHKFLWNNYIQKEARFLSKNLINIWLDEILSDTRERSLYTAIPTSTCSFLIENRILIENCLKSNFKEWLLIDIKFMKSFSVHIDNITRNESIRKYWANQYYSYYYYQQWRYDFSIMHLWFEIEKDLINRAISYYRNISSYRSWNIEFYIRNENWTRILLSNTRVKIKKRIGNLNQFKRLGIKNIIEVLYSERYIVETAKQFRYLTKFKSYRNWIIHTWWNLKFKEIYKYIKIWFEYLNNKNHRNWYNDIYTTVPKRIKWGVQN
jgi:hypothetical protein